MLVINNFLTTKQIVNKISFTNFNLTIVTLDVRTQSNYQGMDPEFIGLIFSVFQNEKSDKVIGICCLKLFFSYS